MSKINAYTKDDVLSMVQTNGLALNDVSCNFKDDADIVWAAVKNNVYALTYASDRFKDDRELVLEAVKRDGCLLYQVSYRLSQDLEICMEALFQNRHLMSVMSMSIKSNPGIVFVHAIGNFISIEDWPIVKRAILEQPDLFFNPLSTIASLVEDLPNKYAIIAQHVLNMSISVSTDLELPSFT